MGTLDENNVSDTDQYNVLCVSKFTNSKSLKEIMCSGTMFACAKSSQTYLNDFPK